MNNWDKFFLEVCDVISRNTKCLSRKVGAILVSDNRIISQGYNGSPSGVPHCWERIFLDNRLKDKILDTKKITENSLKIMEPICPRRLLGFESGMGLEYCIAGHAERNALITAAREGISTKGKKLYMNCGIPCSPCLIEIINAGIEEIVVTKIEYYDLMSEWILKNSKLKYRKYE